MNNKFVTIFLISISMFFIACDEDSITEAILGANLITLSGDISESFDVATVAGVGNVDSISIFSIAMQPADSPISEDLFISTKLSNIIPTVGDYDVGLDSTSSDNFYCLYRMNDTVYYAMHSGTMKITKSGTLGIAGTFDLTGYPAALITDSSRVLKVTGEFSTIPVDFN